MIWIYVDYVGGGDQKRDKMRMIIRLKWLKCWNKLMLFGWHTLKPNKLHQLWPLLPNLPFLVHLHILKGLKCLKFKKRLEESKKKKKNLTPPIQKNPTVYRQ